MSNQDALKPPGTPESSRAPAEINARLGDPEASLTLKERLSKIAGASIDSANKRLLLYEILLDEFKSLEQSEIALSDMDVVKTTSAQIRDEGESFKELWSVLPEDERDEYEEKFNGALTKKVYDLLRQMQAFQTEAARARFEKIYEAIGDKSEREETIREAFEQDIYGELEAERTKLRKDKIKNTLQAELAAERMRLREELKDSEALEESGEEREKRLDEEIEKRLFEKEIESQLFNNIRRKVSRRTALQGQEQRDNGTESSLDGERIRPFETLLAQTQRSALCLSGGGIRSATFNLGILQGLARHGLLERFDYLSTVSGGGFVGGWLSAWIQRRGLRQVMLALKKTPESPLEPEAKPIIHLRNYSNFLSPKLGLLYADTWALVATLVRNMILTGLVFVPFLMAVLMAPRLWIALLHRSSFDNQIVPGSFAASLGRLSGWLNVSNSEMVCILIGYLTGWLALTYIGSNLPSTQGKDSHEGNFFKWCLLPMVISAIAFSMFWLRLRQRGGSLALQPIFGSEHPPDWLAMVTFGITLIAVPWVICVLYRRRTDGGQRFWKFFLGSGFATVLIAIAQVVNGFFLWYAATRLFSISGSDYDTRFYAIFAVPIVLAIWSLSGVLMAGFTSRFTKDEDQEWWARAGAWMMIVMVAWVLINTLVLYAPSWFLSVSTKIMYPLSTELSWQDTAKIVVGVFSVVAAILGGFSSKTPANQQQAKQSGLKGKLVQIAVNLCALIGMAFLLIIIIIVTNILLTKGFGTTLNQKLTLSNLSYNLTDHKSIIFNSGFWYLLLFTVFITLFSIGMGWLISTNRFSLHYMWRNRIIRAYLGASRKERNPNLFTGFDTCDNTPMYKLRPDQPEAPHPEPDCPESIPEQRSGKLLHILNIALNLTGGNKLALQDRRAESFTVSPLHCGSYLLGYRRSWKYGGLDDDSISLGTAIAISGAFVSPNMGYMMTSPVLRFLMALFNVRFGWWLGNPGRAGEGIIPSVNTFNHRSPVHSVKPIVQEAFGMISDKSDYVYLSDGGHFENLGLYEMVLRRCRFIVVSDASTDADYSFGSLAMSIRQIRVDLGVPIDMQDFSIFHQSEDRRGKYCSIGKIRYSCVDGASADESDGVLIYIKAALIGGEPRDVLNYSKESGDFPQEVIVDQWFSEAQFESYRALGSHIISDLCGGDEREINLATFYNKVREHIRLNYGVFDEQISYAAFEHQFKEDMLRHAPESFKDKVKERIEKTLGEK